MATVAETRLFPPIIETYIPAKNIHSIEDLGGIRIPFQVNQYTDISDITEIHVSILRQSNYQTLLNKAYYPLGIFAIKATQEIFTNGYITIPKTTTIGGTTYNVLLSDELDFNEYYKVQLRFSSVTPGTSDVNLCYNKVGIDLSNCLLDETHLAQYSEWSSVGLVRFVAPPTITVDANSINHLAPGITNNVEAHYLQLVGSYLKQGTTTVLGKTFNCEDDNEYLSGYQIQLLSGSTVLTDSGIQTINFRGDKTNQFDYYVPYYLTEQTSYTVSVKLITANYYEITNNYTVYCSIVDNNWQDQQLLAEFTSKDSVIGKVNITFEPYENVASVTSGHLSIIRSSKEDNFTRWDEVWSYNITAETPITRDHPAVFNDFTIESGNIYQYSISYTKSNGDVYVILEQPALSVFDNAFLTKKDTQLCVKFNPNVSNFKINVSDNIVTTIGGKYPYITRNGNMRYRTFSLSGTIAYEMDAEHQFATRSSIYGEWINFYGTYFVNRYINQQNDRITQREFRELVMDFLYEDKPKLFRSTPEGNILVRLTDITLTPKQELARMIYDFSCTATEIGECTVDNYKYYDII